MEFLIIYLLQQITPQNYLAQHCKVQNDSIQSKPCNTKLPYLHTVSVRRPDRPSIARAQLTLNTKTDHYMYKETRHKTKTSSSQQMFQIYGEPKVGQVWSLEAKTELHHPAPVIITVFSPF
jgi:hypothetical protein